MTSVGISYNARDLIFIPFPFAELSQNKIRPALILYKSKLNDILIAPITSNKGIKLSEKEPITDNDLETGNLAYPSNILYMKLFTLSENQVIRKFATVKTNKFKDIINKIDKILSSIC